MAKHPPVAFLFVLLGTGVYFFVIAWYSLSAGPSSSFSHVDNNNNCDHPMHKIKASFTSSSTGSSFNTKQNQDDETENDKKKDSTTTTTTVSSTSSLKKNQGMRSMDEFSFDDAWWLEEKEVRGWFERTYHQDAQFDKSQVRDLFHLERKQNKNQKQGGSLKNHFHPICGNYNFNLTLLPTVSVIMTTQNEEPGWMEKSVHSILARTPPQLLQQILVVDDNGNDPKDPSLRAVSPALEEEMTRLKQIPKVTVLQNTLRQGCARSRLVGARAATGDVVVFVDSHIEMIHSTWYQHLVLPILQQPNTMAVQTIEVISDDGSEAYWIPGSPAYGVFDKEVIFRWLQSGFDTWGQPRTDKDGKPRPHPKYPETPSHRHWYETPVGPGAMFAMSRHAFWRVGGYDTGLYVWGGENIELALKTWMCGGRVVMVPCSRCGHLFRQERLKSKDKTKKNWPPVVPFATQNASGILNYPSKNATTSRWKGGSDFHKITTRNSIRVVEMWVGDHPARDKFYQTAFALSRDQMPPEWKQYIDEMNTDPALLEQQRLKRENKCHDFEWYTRNVLMKVVGKSHPWAITDPPKATVPPGVTTTAPRGITDKEQKEWAEKLDQINQKEKAKHEKKANNQKGKNNEKKAN
ncbi:Polypeptide N-acetylgalactosaminyltransferase [Seminavis robusta]|uniref:Polypeptide N-acetylgalactosaminyltransferase n=1 Tax=Seminavis robusta TaxID=568900 RepID=A0A9N8EBR3_9STRA|nr:Polypeptide N-acetylgalactosaminyltransferase [Seminavis robusta]|eukprot:Sro937_g222190.1 Polypeptide N-acetylgalactosaminyltransferase (633) ;mRNA; f:19491-21389